MHMLCSKCRKSIWLGYTRPSSDVYCANCGKLLISRAAAAPIRDPVPLNAGAVVSRLREKGGE